MKPFKEHFKKAESLLGQASKSKDAARKAEEKMKKNWSVFKKLKHQLSLFVSIVKDYSSGAYSKIPRHSIVAILAALIYVVVPFDAIPDFVPGIGFIDDLSVITFVFNQVAKDLKKYEEWKNNFSVSSDQKTAKS